MVNSVNSTHKMEAVTLKQSKIYAYSFQVMTILQIDLQAVVSGFLQARDRRRKTNRHPIETCT